MSDLRHTCERWAEPISMAAAGCLSADELQEVHRQIHSCAACRERFRQLAELCGALADLRSPTGNVEATIVDRVMADIAPPTLRQPIAAATAEASGPAPLTRPVLDWRWIMRSPVSRVAAAIIFLLAITGVTLWFYGGGTTPALADFITPLLDAKNVKYKVTTEISDLAAYAKQLSAGVAQGLSPEMKKKLEAAKGKQWETKMAKDMQQRLSRKTTGEVMMLDDARSRQEMEMPDGSRTVMIFDWRQGKMLNLSPAEKLAIVFDYTNMPEDQKSKSGNFLAQFRSLLLDARDKPDAKRESLGEKDIDGQRVVGFHVSGGGMTLDLWGDPKTGLPVRLEGTMAMMPNVKVTMSDFAFNVAMDESLFSIEPPAGYEVIKAPAVDVSPPQEKDLIDTFRRYSELSGGLLPDSLDLGPVFAILARKFQPKPSPENAGKPPKPSAKQMQAMLESQLKLQRGVLFATTLSPEAEAHYAGKGVSLGKAETPIFWYRPKDAKNYRVIYADLTVREADAPPAVPNAQPVPAPSSSKK